jgi:NAD(P)H-hydrate repair Nnr-like enzyme with NAD(P)H-hydrate epimerase domain
VLDALIGYSLRGDPHGRAAELIRWANEQEAPVCWLDVPSGFDATFARGDGEDRWLEGHQRAARVRCPGPRPRPGTLGEEGANDVGHR